MFFRSRRSRINNVVELVINFEAAISHLELDQMCPHGRACVYFVEVAGRDIGDERWRRYLYQREWLVRVKIDHLGQIIGTGNTNRRCLVNRIAKEIRCSVDALPLARLLLCAVTWGAVEFALDQKEPILRLTIIRDWRDGATLGVSLFHKHTALQSVRLLLNF